MSVDLPADVGVGGVETSGMSDGVGEHEMARHIWGGGVDLRGPERMDGQTETGTDDSRCGG